MVDFIIVNKGVVSIHSCTEDWPSYPNRLLKEQPKAKVYRRRHLQQDYCEYFLDKPKRHPRMVRWCPFDHNELPAAVKAALLLKPI